MIYESVCEKCGKEHEYVSSVDERNNNLPICCGQATTREMRTSAMISAMVWTSHKAHMVGGIWCESGDEAKAAMRKQGLESYSDGISQANISAKRVKLNDEKNLNDCVEKAFRTVYEGEKKLKEKKEKKAKKEKPVKAKPKSK